MNWTRRLILAAFTLGLAFLFGVIGGFLGTRLPFLLAAALPFVVGFLLFPWKAPLEVIPSQETLAEGLQSFQTLAEDMKKRSERVAELQAKLDAEALPREELEQARQEFWELRTLEVELQQQWRELFFPEERRTQIIPLLMMVMAAAGGSVLAITFAKWLV
jgi:hypothetical protein